MSKTTGKYIEKINKKYTYINKTIEETYTKENSIYKKIIIQSANQLQSEKKN